MKLVDMIKIAIDKKEKENTIIKFRRHNSFFATEWLYLFDQRETDLSNAIGHFTGNKYVYWIAKVSDLMADDWELWQEDYLSDHRTPCLDN